MKLQLTKELIETTKQTIELTIGREVAWSNIAELFADKEGNVYRIIKSEKLGFRKCPLYINQYNYQLVSCKGRSFYISRIVFNAWNPEVEIEGFDIDHIDENRSNNNIENLQRLTHAENCLKRERNYPRSTAVFLLDDLGEPIKRYNSVKDAADDLDLDQPSIYHVLSGRYKHHKGHVFKKVTDVHLPPLREAIYDQIVLLEKIFEDFDISHKVYTDKDFEDYKNKQGEQK